MTITYAVGTCTLGHLLAAASERGLCAIFLGDEPEMLVGQLRKRFRTATLLAGDRDFDRWLSQAIELVEQPSRGSDVALDIHGTDFQIQVWEALRQVPAGSTVSYVELAKRIGRPTAARAVAQACGANRLAVVIPCHRVIRADSSLSGYRWGVARKAELLKREQ